MRQVMRVPMMLKMLRSEENRRKVLEYWFKIPGGEQTEIGHPYYEIGTILDYWKDNLVDVESFWRNNIDLRLPQVLININIMPNFPGFYYHKEDEETFIEAGIFEPRDILFWGNNYNEKMEKLPETKWILVRDMGTAHIEAILNDVKELRMKVSSVYLKAFKDEIKLRNKDVIEAIDYFENQGFIEELTTDKKHYVEILIKAVKLKL